VSRQPLSLCSIGHGHPFVPTCLLAERRAQRQSGMPARMRRHRRSRREASLTERARRYASGAGTIAASPVRQGYRPAFFTCSLVGGPPPSRAHLCTELAQAEISSVAVIPGWPRGPGPESKNTQAVAIAGYLAARVCMGSRLAGSRPRPGTTKSLPISSVTAILCTGEPIKAEGSPWQHASDLPRKTVAVIERHNTSPRLLHLGYSLVMRLEGPGCALPHGLRAA
jgi:hypothetical protein